MSWTQRTDVARRYPRPIPAPQHGWVDSLIDDAEDALSQVVADLGERIEADEVPLQRVKRIVATAVIAVLRNPDGYVSRSTTRGPFSESVTRTADGAGVGRIRFSDEDLSALRPTVSPVGSVGVTLSPWQVPTGPQERARPDPYWPPT